MGVRDFFQSVPPEDFKWNSPNELLVSTVNSLIGVQCTMKGQLIFEKKSSGALQLYAYTVLQLLN